MQDEEIVMFWHRESLNEVRALLAKSAAVMIIGGRGTGKTLLLRQVGQELMKQFATDSMLILDGLLGESARSMVLNDTQPRRAILIDNLDILLKAREGDQPADIEKITGALLSRLSMGCLLLATSSIEVDSPSDHRLTEALKDEKAELRWKDIYSRLTQQFQRHILNPWKGDWGNCWIREFNTAFLGPIKGEFLLGTWRTIILNSTGGHPSLFGPLVQHLRSLCSAGVSDPSTDPFVCRMLEYSPAKRDSASRAELEENIRHYVEDFLVKHAARTVKSALRRLKESPNRTEAESFRVLVQMAMSNAARMKPPDNPEVRRVLIDEALVYKDENGHYVIPGTLVRHLILECTDFLEPLVMIKPDARDSRRKGEIVVRSASGDQTIPISGAPWRVLWTLYQNTGKVVLIDDIRELTDLKKARAVSNAIQRLYTQLKPYKLTGLIENQRGEGYRLTSSHMKGEVIAADHGQAFLP